MFLARPQSGTDVAKTPRLVDEVRCLVRKMQITIRFHSYFKDLAGRAETTESLSDGSTLGELCQKLIGRYPRLAAMQRSTLMAVGVDYQGRDYVLRDGDEVSLFPPVQGG